MTSAPQQAIILITGIQAAGKSTIAQMLAERLPRSVHVRGDLFRRMVINGRADMTPDPSAEAVRQLRLRRSTLTACRVPRRRRRRLPPQRGFLPRAWRARG
jgi:cytidylate kinase